MNASDCIFCTMGQDPGHPAPIYRDDLVFVLRDINPQAAVHLLVIPNTHVAALGSVAADQSAALGHMLTVAGDMAGREGVASSGYRLVINQGRDSGQEIEHLHLHLLAGQPLHAMG